MASDPTPEEIAAGIADNLDSYLRSSTMTPKVIIAAHIREAVRLANVEAEKSLSALREQIIRANQETSELRASLERIQRRARLTLASDDQRELAQDVVAISAAVIGEAT